MISAYDRKYLDNIMSGEGDWFTAQVLRLCAKADPGNLERLRIAFPEVVELYLAWLYRPARVAPLDAPVE